MLQMTIIYITIYTARVTESYASQGESWSSQSNFHQNPLLPSTVRIRDAHPLSRRKNITLCTPKRWAPNILWWWQLIFLIGKQSNAKWKVWHSNSGWGTHKNFASFWMTEYFVAGVGFLTWVHWQQTRVVRHSESYPHTFWHFYCVRRRRCLTRCATRANDLPRVLLL